MSLVYLPDVGERGDVIQRANDEAAETSKLFSTDVDEVTDAFVVKWFLNLSRRKILYERAIKMRLWNRFELRQIDVHQLTKCLSAITHR